MESRFVPKRHLEPHPSKYYHLRISNYIYHSVGVYVGAGSREESPQTHGVSYLL